MFKDKRSGKLALTAHCILNQNSRVSGLAKRSSVITEIVELLMQKEIAVIQMPCPELTYAGLSRQAKTKDEYDNAVFRKHCRKIAEEIADQIQEYTRRGIETKIVLGVDGSPSCGVNKASERIIRESASAHDKEGVAGILIEELQLAFKKRKISVPFHGITYESLPEDLAKIDKLLEG